MSNNREAILLDAVAAVHGHGFADIIGDLTIHPYGYTMAVVSPVLLLNIGETDIARRLESINVREVSVITRETDNGDRTVFKVGDTVTVGRAWDALESEHADAFPEEV